MKTSKNNKPSTILKCQGCVQLEIFSDQQSYTAKSASFVKVIQTHERIKRLADARNKYESGKYKQCKHDCLLSFGFELHVWRTADSWNRACTKCPSRSSNMKAPFKALILEMFRANHEPFPLHQHSLDGFARIEPACHAYFCLLGLCVLKSPVQCSAYCCSLGPHNGGRPLFSLHVSLIYYIENKLFTCDISVN